MSEQWKPRRIWVGVDPNTGQDVWEVERVIPKSEVLRIGRAHITELNRKHGDADG